MKLSSTILALVLVAAQTSSSSGGAGAIPGPEKPAFYLLQVDHTTVATLPGLPPEQMTITSDKVTSVDANTTELSGARIVITLPGHAPVTMAGDRLTLVAQRSENPAATRGAPAELPFRLPVEVAGIKKTFAGKDAIEIKAVRGTAAKFQVGGTYRVSGVCRQESLRHALLHVGNTAGSGAEAIMPVGGSTLDKALPPGSTEFDCTFKLLRPGVLHATIYDLDNHDPHDNAYAGVYLGDVMLDR